MVAAKEMRSTMALVPITSRRVPKRAVEHAQKGNELFSRGDLEAAIAEFDEALRLHSPFGAALNNRAAAFGHLGRIGEALADLNEALRLDAQDAAALFNRALIRVMLDDYEGADDDLTQSLSIQESTAGYNNRGSVRAHLEKHREAISDFNRALQLEPYDLAARFNRSWSLLQLGELDLAIADIDWVLAELEEGSVQEEAARLRRRQILDEYLWRQVRKGELSWSGGKPKGSSKPVRLTPGPPVSDYIIEERRRLRGQ